MAKLFLWILVISTVVACGSSNSFTHRKYRSWDKRSVQRERPEIEDFYSRNNRSPIAEDQLLVKENDVVILFEKNNEDSLFQKKVASNDEITPTSKDEKSFKVYNHYKNFPQAKTFVHEKAIKRIAKNDAEKENWFKRLSPSVKYFLFGFAALCIMGLGFTFLLFLVFDSQILAIAPLLVFIITTLAFIFAIYFFIKSIKAKNVAKKESGERFSKWPIVIMSIFSWIFIISLSLFEILTFALFADFYFNN